MCAIISHFSQRLEAGQRLSQIVNNRGKPGQGGLHFPLYLPSSPPGELRHGGNFRPLGHSAVRKNEQRQGKRENQSFLMKVCVCVCMYAMATLALQPFLSICVFSSQGSGG